VPLVSIVPTRAVRPTFSQALLSPEVVGVRGELLSEIALWLAGKSLKTKDVARLALDGLGTVGRLLG